MILVAVIAVLLGLGVHQWRRYQLDEFARKYALGYIEISEHVDAEPGRDADRVMR
jgi:hypothetical protein